VLENGQSVFFSDTSRGRLEHAATFRKVCLELGLVPVHYTGAGSNIRGTQIERELERDFSKAHVAVVYFGERFDESDPADNWAIPELSRAARRGIPVFVYKLKHAASSPALTSLSVTTIEENEFESRLRDDLKLAMGI